MCGKATDAMEVSSTSMKVASITDTRDQPRIDPRPPGRFRGGQDFRMWRRQALMPGDSFDFHLRFDRHARGDIQLRIQWLIKNNLDWNALHHLDVIAHRILGRQQAELRARARPASCPPCL